MSLQIATNINVDFYDKKYIMLNAKQYDDCSRWITITCYNDGKIFNLNNNQHTVYVRYRKADDYSVLNCCRINHKGEVLVELTEQMLAAEGICYADLIVVNKGSAIINIDTGEIITIDGSAILSTMAFCINVYESAIDSSVIESSNEFDAFNDALQKVEADYTEVIQLSKSYAMGDANNVRENEDVDNSKYYYQLARSYTVGDNGMRSGEDIDNAEYYYQMSKSYSIGDTDINIRADEDIDNSKYYSELSKSYARGGTGIEARTTEDVDNAEYYSRLAKSYAIGSLDGATGIRDDESTENAKTYMETTKDYRDTTISNTNTTQSYMETTEGYMKTTEEYKKTVNDCMVTTQNYMSVTEGYMNNAKDYKDEAFTSANSASNSEIKAGEYMEAAKSSENAAFQSETNAKTSETNAAESANKASVSEANASESAIKAKEISDSISVDVESIANNAQIASNSAISASSSAANALEDATDAAESAARAEDIYTAISNSVTGAFIPMGTITFEELKNLEDDGKVVGYLYHISDAFTTDDTFKKPDVECIAGTNVYLTADNNKWDYLVNPTIATVDEMKSFLGI